MQIRQLGSEDWEAFRTIRLAALAEAPGNFFSNHAHEAALPREHWTRLLDDPCSALFGLLDSDTLVGITGVFASRDDPAAAQFGMTHIAPAYRGHGLTALLYDARIDWARSHGFARILVSHRASNTPSRRAIERAGFQRTGSRDFTWPDGVREEDVQYELPL